jgi:tetratricopeptide (TPR) repeat protein
MEMKPYDPHKAEKDVEVGDFYYKRGNYKAAVSRYQEALELGPPSASATFKLADALEKDKRPADAAVYYREYVRQYPQGAQLADARAALERIAPAIQDAGRVQQAEVARGLEAGETFLAQKNYSAAMERFCDVADIAPDNARALFRLAQALQATGEFAAAYQNYQGYLKLEPNGDLAPAARREVQRLAPQLQQGKVTSPSSETRP